MEIPGWIPDWARNALAWAADVWPDWLSIGEVIAAAFAIAFVIAFTVYVVIRRRRGGAHSAAAARAREAAKKRGTSKLGWTALFFATGIAMAITYDGMLRFFDHQMKIEELTFRIVLASIFEVSAVGFFAMSREFRLERAARFAARDAERRTRLDADPDADVTDLDHEDAVDNAMVDVDGRAGWTVLLMSGTFAATDASGWASPFRLMLPILAGFLLERLVSGEMMRIYRTIGEPGAVKQLVHRLKVRLNLAAADKRSVGEQDLDLRITRLVKVGTAYNATPSWLVPVRWWRRMRVLAINDYLSNNYGLADDPALREKVARRVLARTAAFDLAKGNPNLPDVTTEPAAVLPQPARRDVPAPRQNGRVDDMPPAPDPADADGRYAALLNRYAAAITTVQRHIDQQEREKAAAAGVPDAYTWSTRAEKVTARDIVAAGARDNQGKLITGKPTLLTISWLIESLSGRAGDIPADVRTRYGLPSSSEVN